MEQVRDPADHAAIGQQAHLQAHQIEQVEFAFRQGRPVAGGHQQGVAHQGFGAGAIVDPLQPQHIELPAGELAAAQQGHRLGRPRAALQPALAWNGEAFGEIAERIEAQFSLQALGRHQPAHLQQVARVPSRAARLGAGLGPGRIRCPIGGLLRHGSRLGH